MSFSTELTCYPWVIIFALGCRFDSDIPPSISYYFDDNLSKNMSNQGKLAWLKAMDLCSLTFKTYGLQHPWTDLWMSLYLLLASVSIITQLVNASFHIYLLILTFPGGSNQMFCHITAQPCYPMSLKCSLRNEMPKTNPLPKIVTLTTIGVTPSSRSQVPFLLNIFYGYMISHPLQDKLGTDSSAVQNFRCSRNASKTRQGLSIAHAISTEAFPRLLRLWMSRFNRLWEGNTSQLPFLYLAAPSSPLPGKPMFLHYYIESSTFNLWLKPTLKWIPRTLLLTFNLSLLISTYQPSTTSLGKSLVISHHLYLIVPISSALYT
jgi:hypothetical protein